MHDFTECEMRYSNVGFDWLFQATELENFVVRFAIRTYYKVTKPGSDSQGSCLDIATNTSRCWCFAIKCHGSSQQRPFL